MKELFSRLWPSAVTVVLIASIPLGLSMAWYTGDADWLWLCAPIFFFLS